ncbi:MAG: hypothetical protein V3V96_12850, partial [Acidiferrobacterales bacterium]
LAQLYILLAWTRTFLHLPGRPPTGMSEVRAMQGAIAETVEMQRIVGNNPCPAVVLRLTTMEGGNAKGL